MGFSIFYSSLWAKQVQFGYFLLPKASFIEP